MKTESKVEQLSKASTVAEFLEMQFNLCGKSQSEIAQEIGFKNANVITMLKQGRTKVPVNRIGALATALEVDPLHLFKMVMQEYQPETWDALEKYVLKQPFVSENELEILKVVRESNVTNPKIRTARERTALVNVINTFRPDNAVQGD